MEPSETFRKNHLHTALHFRWPSSGPLQRCPLCQARTPLVEGLLGVCIYSLHCDLWTWVLEIPCPICPKLAAGVGKLHLPACLARANTARAVLVWGLAKIAALQWVCRELTFSACDAHKPTQRPSWHGTRPNKEKEGLTAGQEPASQTTIFRHWTKKSQSEPGLPDCDQYIAVKVER